MAISGIVGQGVSTQAARGFLQNVSGLAGRVIGIFQNKYLAAAALGATMFVLIRTINKVAPKIVESKLVKNVSANFFEKRSDKYNLSREALTWMSASLIMVVGMLGVSKLLQLPFSRAATLALAGWTLFSYAAYLHCRRESFGDRRVEEALNHSHGELQFDDDYEFGSSGSESDDGVIDQPRRRNPPTEAAVVDESLMSHLTSRQYSTRFSQDN